MKLYHRTGKKIADLRIAIYLICHSINNQVSLERKYYRGEAMRILRYIDSNGEEQYGWLSGDFVGLIEGDIFSVYQRHEANIPLENITLLPPVKPTKIICVAQNFSNSKDDNVEIPEIPIIFSKPITTLNATKQSIVLPPQSKQVEFEAEMAIIMGKKGRWISAENALDYVLGYTIANDVTAKDLMERDFLWTRAKGFDTFCPLGPWIDTDFDPSDAVITCRVNKDLRQMATTTDMIFSVRQLIAFISSIMTLEPSDVILTGTPGGVGKLDDGDIVEITIEGLGVLWNSVIVQPPIG